MDKVRLGFVAAAVVLAANVLVLATGAASDGDDVSTATTAPVVAPGVPGETVPGADVGATDTTAAPAAAGETTTSAATSATQPAGGATTTLPPDEGPTMPAPGRYTYNVSGSSSLGQVPPQATILLERLSDTDQRETAESPQGNTVQVNRYTADAVLLVSLDLQALGKSFRPNPPVAFTPLPPEVGRSWEWTMSSTDSSITIHHLSTITGTEVVTIAGQPVDSFVVQTRLELSGQAQGRIDVTTWASPAHGLGVRTHTVTSVTYILPITSDITSTLVSLNPS
ncbi:MAG: hypothetical protein ACRD0U_11095 [Acidimicrobiales bacterium]